MTNVLPPKLPLIHFWKVELERKKDLLSGRGDLAVHSWKDLPIDTEPGTFICGTLQRADMRDMLFLKKSSKNKTFLEILSSSPRREKNWELNNDELTKLQNLATMLEAISKLVSLN